MRAIPLVTDALVLAAVGLLAACSANAPAPQHPSTSVAPTGHGGFAHCLSEHGVPSPPGSVAAPPKGVDPDTWHRAMQACASLAPGPTG